MSRPRLFPDRALSAAERQRRHRARLRGELQPWQPNPKPRPPQFEDTFLEGLHDIDELFDPANARNETKRSATPQHP
jgi:hypothetical protein